MLLDLEPEEEEDLHQKPISKSHDKGEVEKPYFSSYSQEKKKERRRVEFISDPG